MNQWNVYQRGVNEPTESGMYWVVVGNEVQLSDFVCGKFTEELYAGALWHDELKGVTHWMPLETPEWNGEV